MELLLELGFEDLAASLPKNLFGVMRDGCAVLVGKHTMLLSRIEWWLMELTKGFGLKGEDLDVVSQRAGAAFGLCSASDLLVQVSSVGVPHAISL